MSNWYFRNLGDALMSSQSLEDIRAIFLSDYTQVGNPENMAMFIRHESEGRLHCEVVVYFSPASAAIAEAVGARPCRKPSSVNLSLLHGDEDSWMTLFPEQK